MPGVGGLKAAYTGPYVRAPRPPTPALLGPTGPASLSGHSPRAERTGWVVSRYYPPGIPTVYRTRPVQQLPPSPRHRRCHGRGDTGTCTYDQFDTVQGEPRGPEHTPVFRVLAVFSTALVLAVLHLIMTETGLWDPLRMRACGRSIMRSILGSILGSILSTF